MTPLGTNIEQLKADFESVTGKPFRHFFCPILHVDEEVALCRGHVVPESLGGKAKVLQRADVDQGFGSFFEAEAIDAVRYGLDGSPLDVVFGGDEVEIRKLQPRFGFHLLLEGTNKSVEASFRRLGDETGFCVEREHLEAALARKIHEKRTV